MVGDIYPARATAAGIEIAVKAVPKSSRDRVVGVLAGRLKVCVTAAPEKGRANAAVVAVIAGWLDVPKSSVALLAGAASPAKTVQVRGVTLDKVTARIESLA